MNAFRRRFGQLIRAGREARNLTQAQLAAELWLDQPTMSRIEAGEQRIPEFLFTRIMDRLKIKPDLAIELSRETWTHDRRAEARP